MYSSLKILYLFPTFLIILATVKSLPAETVQQKLHALINYNLATQIFPKTVRLISYDTVSSNFEINFLQQNNIPLIVGDNKPIITSLDPRLISTGRKTGFHEMFKYVVVIFINNPRNIANAMTSLANTVNRRWDKLIIVSQEKEILEQVMSNKTTQDFKEKYAMDLGSGEIWADPFIYNNGKMIQLNFLEEIPSRNKMGGNLHGRHLNIAGTEFPPFMFKTTHENGSVSYHGTHVNIVKAASEIFNYTFEVSYDWNYGEYWPNGTWTGMYARVYYPERNYHFTIALSYEYYWYYGVDFATMTDSVTLMFATNQPRTKLEWYAFLLPFSKLVWICILITYVFLGIVQFIVMYFVHDRKLKYVVWDSGLFLPFAMATEQGLMDIPKGARYLSLVWLLGCLVLGTGYKSTLRNNLSFPTPEIIPLTFEELANAPDYGVTLFSSGSTEKNIIEGSPTATMMNIRKRMKFSDDLDKCIRDVYQNPHTTCIAWSCLLHHQTARSLTVNIRVAPLAFSRGSPKVTILSMAFQKDSIFVDAFSRIMEGAFETGLVAKWKSDEDHTSKKEGIDRMNKERQSHLYHLLWMQTKASVSDRNPLTLINLWAIFLILPIGMSLGIILASLECGILKIKSNCCCSLFKYLTSCLKLR